LSYTESNIIQEISTGSEKAFEQLFRTYYSGLCGYAIKYVWDPDQAEEIVQNLFYNLWNKKGNLSVDLSIEAYLFRAVRNACLNYLKHQKIRQHHAEAVKKIPSAEVLTEENPVETLELQNKIEEAVDGLPPERKKIFLMSRYEGMKYKDIAQHLGISVKTVEAQMGKALKSLRENLADYLVVTILMVVEIILFFLGNE
jgi:RNA polymerase sigma-70 factor (ECF subfamily)